MTPEQFNEIIIRLDKLIEKESKPYKTVFTIIEASDMLKVSRATISRAIKANQLRPYKLGDWRITEEQLNEWLETRRPVKIKRGNEKK